MVNSSLSSMGLVGLIKLVVQGLSQQVHKESNSEFIFNISFKCGLHRNLGIDDGICSINGS